MRMSCRLFAWVVPYGWRSMQTSFAPGARFFSLSHSRIVAVAPWRVASTQDSLSETITTRSTVRPARVEQASGAETLVPPPPIAAELRGIDRDPRERIERQRHHVALERQHLAPAGLRRSTAAATRAATSMQRTFDEAPLR